MKILPYSSRLGIKNAFRLISSVQKQSKLAYYLKFYVLLSYFFICILLNPGILTVAPNFSVPCDKERCIAILIIALVYH